MQVVKNSVIYLSSSIISKLIPFLLLPILTKYLTPSEYGLLSIYMILITLYSAFVGMAIHTSISKYFHHISKKDLSLFVGNMYIILFSTFVIYLSLTYLYSLYFDSIFSIPIKWIMILPMISAMLMINEINITILRNEQRAYMFGIFEISNSIVKISLILIFLLVFSMGWYSQVIGIFLSALIFFIIGIIYLKNRNYSIIKFDKSKILKILKISIPLIPHIVAGIIITVSDRLFIEHMIGLDAVGLYSIGYMFGMVVVLFSDAFLKAWSPWFYKNIVTTDTAKQLKIVKFTYLYIIAVVIIAFSVSFIADIIFPYVVDERYLVAKEYIFWIALSYAMFGIYQIFFPYLIHLNKTSFLAISTGLAALINLIFNYILIPKYGPIGAAYATFIAYFASAVIVFLYQSKQINMPWALGVKNEKNEYK